MFRNYIYLIYVSKKDLVLNNVKWWIWHRTLGGASGVMSIVVGIGHGDTSSNPG